MNTILTDDEGHRAVNSATSGTSLEIFRKVEAAVLAKLREQEPVGFVTSLQWRTYQTEQVRKITRTRQPEHDFVAPIYAAPQPAVVQVPQGIDVEGRRIAAEAENHACSIAVWMTRMDAESPDADALGVSGWLQEAETRIKRRMLAAAPEAPAQLPRDECFTNGNICARCGHPDFIEAQSIPAPWREAVKVAREALATVQASVAEEGISAGRREYRSELFTRMAAVLSQLDALEGGK